MTDPIIARNLAAQKRKKEARAADQRERESKQLAAEMRRSNENPVRNVDAYEAVSQRMAEDRTNRKLAMPKALGEGYGMKTAPALTARLADELKHLVVAMVRAGPLVYLTRDGVVWRMTTHSGYERLRLALAKLSEGELLAQHVTTQFKGITQPAKTPKGVVIPTGMLP